MSGFNYMLLGRLESDCEYFLHYGNGCEKHLWAHTVEAQIAKMKELWVLLEEKPVWLPYEQILTYEKEMLNQKNNILNIHNEV